MTTTIQGPLVAITCKEVLRAIYGLDDASTRPALHHEPVALRVIGVTHMDALTKWLDAFSEYLSEQADSHDFQHLIWWVEPLRIGAVDHMPETFIARGKLVIW